MMAYKFINDPSPLPGLPITLNYLINVEDGINVEFEKWKKLRIKILEMSIGDG